MALDKCIAALFLVLSLIYGYAALDYPLLPFERHMAFKPNTWPTVLSIAAAILSLLILILPAKAEGAREIDLRRPGDYKMLQGALIIAAMVFYALMLRPGGFLLSTTLFLVATGAILGERNFRVLVPVAFAGALFVWLIVQEALGIFLRPFPGFLG